MGHRANWGLVGQEVAAVQGLVAVLIFGVALLPGHFIARIDATLGTHAVGSLDWDKRKEVDLQPRLNHPGGCGESGQAAANDNDSGATHEKAPLERGAAGRTDIDFGAA